MTTLQAEKPNIKLLYLRLTDSAPLIVAKELGLFERYGLNVELQRETSWATLRDKLIGGAADAAAMLAPMPLTVKQTLPHCEEQLLSGLILSCNGNAITLSRALYDQLELASDGPVNIGAALNTHIASRASETNPLTFASVYPFASHTLQLRYWLNHAGIDPDQDVRLVVLPPEQMVDHLRRGDIDGYCVGEPWNTLAVQQGIGVIVAPSNTLMPAMPEKVLAVTQSWHDANPATHLALRAALLAACGWLNDRSHRRDAVGILARPEYLNLPEETIAASLEDQVTLHRGHAGHGVKANPDWHLFAHPQTDHGLPSTKKGRELLALCNEIAPTDSTEAEVFRADLYQQTLDFLRHQNQQFSQTV
ncbi:CmpA/NrtA family ABC transporter substrate-binding protein [Microbulbifer bruguierae]|uniref:CmpA/NrtA family ABC transporter substrate-binding protein n=1 Tax=Microbulbifer bruguierae TaxID=3029061 RepID=A0ABY8NDU2_9GAMM|nr:CmpA/NrtA family ABC transporter substrate-binding protein [Microbulbifer bruguierae]WGL16252.1 CmpA/NrtA family ABC transporter substrate-binding protein [Microbulbifer bruguierae]